MEPLSIIAFAITIVDSISKTYTTIKKITGLPRAFDKVEEDLPLVNNILRDADERLRGDPKPTIEQSNNIVQALNHCLDQAKELKRIFDETEAKCKEDQDAKDWVKVRVLYHTALRGVEAHRVERLMKDILQTLEKLALGQVFRLALQKDLVAIKKAIEDLSKVEPSLPDSEFERPGRIIANQTVASQAIAQQNNVQGGSNTFMSGKNPIGGSGHQITLS